MAADVDPKLASQAAEAAPRPAAPRRFPLPQLRLHDRRVYVGFGPTPLSEGLAIADLALIVPDVSFPFDIAGGAATRYQRAKCRFGYLDLEVGHELFSRAARRVGQACAEHLAGLKLRLSPTVFEGEGSLHAPGSPAPFTFRVGFAPEGSGVIACVFDVRLYGPAPVPAPFAAAVIARAALHAAVVPDAQAFGAIGLAFDPVVGLVRRAVPLRGFKVPDCADARLERVEPGPHAFHLHFAAGARPELPLDAELLGCVEGTRAFAEGEALLAQGDLAAAEAYYLRRGEAPDAHPFARERLLGLLAARSDGHDLALDLAALSRQSRPGSAASYWAEAGIRQARGEGKLAGELYLELGRLARTRGEETSAFQAFAAAGRALLEPSPSQASRAFQEALAIRPDDFDSLKALAIASDRASDHEAALRAYRRIAALARDPAQAARAHVRLGELLTRLTRDRAAARLHFDAALRRVPAEADALLGLSRLCRADGEHLRALKLLDELRVEAARRGDAELEARACLEAGAAWDEGLAHPANALLRYQEAEKLAPAAFEASLRLGILYERLGRPAEAVDALQRAAVAAEGLLGRAQVGEAARAAALRAHHALARLASERLSDEAAARRHFEAILALDKDDPIALRAMLKPWRAENRQQQLAHACERCALATANPIERALLLAEAGELLAGALAEPRRAEALLDQALLVDPECRRALEATARLAETNGDGGKLCRALLKLAEGAVNRAQKAALLRRLARAARDVAADLDLATDALSRALDLEPQPLADRAELCELQRRRGDDRALAAALSGWAKALEADGQFTLAAGALREQARIADARLGRNAEAISLLEKAAALAPEDRGVLEDLADLSIRSGRPAVAREAYRSLLTSLPREARSEQVARLQAGLGRACEALGDRDSALEAMAIAFACRPLDDDLGERLDALLGDAGREADRAATRLARGRAKRDAKLPSAAAAQFLAAARTFLKLAETVAARSAYAAALDADPDGPTAAVALESLAQEALDAHDDARASDLLARRAAFDLSDREAARRLFQAARLVEQSNPERFQALLGSVLERDGDFPPARGALARQRLTENDLAQVLSHARLALANPSDPDAPPSEERAALQRTAARAAAGLGELAVAGALLTDYCESRPEDVAALQELAELHRRTGAKAELAKTLGRLCARLEGARAAAVMRELAVLLRELPGRREESLQAWRHALELEPDDREALQGLATALDQPSEAAERVGLLRRLIERAQGAERVQLLSDCAASLTSLSHWAEAAKALLQASELSPAPAPLLDRLAVAAQKAKDPGLQTEALARRALLAADAGDPDAPERLLAAGLRLFEQGRAAEARSAVSRAADLAPPDSSLGLDALFKLAELFEAAGERRDAAEVLSRLAERQEGSERCATLVRRVELLRKLGDQSGAGEALSLALAASPGDRIALSLRRQMCIEAADDRGLIGALEALLALPLPDRRQAASQASELADAYLRLGELVNAEAALRKVLSYDRAFAEAEERLFAVLLARGALEEAVPLGERLAASQPAVDAVRRLVELSRLADDGLKDRRLALRCARLAHQRDPAEPVATRRLADLLYLDGSVAEALPLLDRLAREADFAADPEGARDLNLRFSELALEAGQKARACEALRALLDHRPQDSAAAELLYEALLPDDPADAVASLARHARALAPGSRARSLFVRLAEDSRTRLAAPKAAAEFLELAEAIGGEGPDLELTRVEVLREADDKPGLAKALATMAERALAAGELDRALVALDELTDLARPQDPRAAAATLARAADLCERGGRSLDAARRLARMATILHDALGDSSAAERAFRRAFQLEPTEIGWARAASALCRERGDASGEAELLEAMAPRLEGPARCDVLVRLAQLRLDAGDSPGAGDFLEEALRIDPQLERARDLYEQILGLEGRLEDLAKSVEGRAVVEADPEQRAQLFRKAAELYLDRVRDLASGARALKAAHEAQPHDLAIAEACADALASLGRFDEARPLDALVLSYDPTREKPFDRQAAQLKEAGDFGGLAMLLEARASHEGHLVAAGLLIEAAAVRDRLGDGEGAGRDELQAFDLDPTSERAFSSVMARAGSDLGAVVPLMVRRAQAVPGAAAKLHRDRALLLKDAGQAEAAALALDEALAIDLFDAPALALRGEVAEALGGEVAAEPYDRRLLESVARGAPVPAAALARAHYRLGFAAMGRGDGAEAEERLGAGYALDPVHPRAERALEILADLYQRAGDRAMLYRVRMAQASRAANPDARALALAMAADAAPDVVSEVNALAPLVELRPSDFSLLERQAMALSRAGRSQASLSAWRRAAAEASEPAQRCRLLLAASAEAAAGGDADRARSLWQEAFAAHPCLDAARAGLACLRPAGDSAALRQALATLASLSTDMREGGAARLERAQLLDQASDPDAAAAFLEIVRRAPSLPGYAEAAHRALQLLEQQGRFAEAAEAMAAKGRLAEDPASRAGLLVEAARLLDEKADQAQMAEGLLAEAAAAAPASSTPWAAMAAMRERRHDPTGCARALEEEAARTDDGKAKAERLVRASRAWTAASSPERSLASLEAAVESSPDDLQIRLAHADACEAQGLAERALAQVLRVAGAIADDEAKLPLLKRAVRLAHACDRSTEAYRIQRLLFELDPADDDVWQQLRGAPSFSDPKLRAEVLERREAALEAKRPEEIALRVALLCERGLILAGSLAAPQEAEQAWKKALQLDSRNRAALAGLRELAVARRDTAVLLDVLAAEAAAASSPEESFTLLARLGDAAARVDPERAAAAFEGALVQAHAGADVSHVERALAELLIASRPTRSVELLERLVLLAPKDPELRALAAEACQATGDRPGARRHLREAVEAWPERADLVDAFDALCGDSPLDRAWVCGQRARRAVDAGTRVRHLLEASVAWRDAGDPEAEKDTLQLVLAVDPTSTAAFERLGELLAGEPTELLSLLEQRADSVPAARAQLMSRIGQLRLSAADAKGASEAFLQAMEAGDASAVDGLAEARVGDGRVDLTDLEGRLTGGLLAAAGLAIGRRFEQQEKPQEALAHFSLASRHAAEPAEALEGLVRVAEAAGSPAQALEACERLLRIKPKIGRDSASLHLKASEWCSALDRPEDARLHLEVAVLQGAGGATALRRLADQYLAQGTWPEAAATLTWYAEQAEDPAERAGAWRKAAEIYANEAGDLPQAVAVAERALIELPRDAVLLELVCEIEVKRGDAQRIARACERLATVEGPGSLAPFALPLGRALCALGRPAEALPLLKGALERSFDDRLAAEVRDLADAVGEHETAVATELAAVEKLGPDRAPEAASRLRALAARLKDDPQRAADLVARASSLSPDANDLSLEAELREKSGDSAAAVRPLLALARRDPLDLAVLARMARALHASGDGSRAAALESIEAFADSARRFAAAPLSRVKVSDDLRQRAYQATAQGPLARLLRALGPALGAAFPGDLSRHGISEADQVGPMHAPALAARVREARETVGLVAVDAFLASSGGPEVQLEPGAPDRLVVGLPAITELEPGALSYLLVRACELSAAGFALAAQAGDSLEGMLRCALAAAGADLSVPDPFDAMVEPLGESILSYAPPDLDGLVRPAVAALPSLDPTALLDAIEQSASLVALVVCGEPGAALRALVGGAEGATQGLAAAARRTPAIRDVVLGCLRDDWAALRRACTGSQQ